MKLLENWKSVLTKAWSVRLMSVATLAELLLQFVPLFEWIPQWAIIGLLVAALGSRFVAQSGLSLPEAVEPKYDDAL